MCKKHTSKKKHTKSQEIKDKGVLSYEAKGHMPMKNLIKRDMPLKKIEILY